MKNKKRSFKKLALSKKIVANINGGVGGGVQNTFFCQSVDFCETIDFTICAGGNQCQIFGTFEPHCRTF